MVASQRSSICRALDNKCQRSATCTARGAPSAMPRAYWLDRSRATTWIPRRRRSQPANVAARAQAGDTAARSAVNAFSHALGEFAGDLCLAFNATGGAYLTGGVLTGLGGALDADAVIREMKAKVPPYMVPHKIVERANLPRNPNGKMDRKQLSSEVGNLFPGGAS